MHWLCSMAAVTASTSNCGCRSCLIMNTFSSKGLYSGHICFDTYTGCRIHRQQLCLLQSFVVLVRSGSWEVAGRLDTFAIRPGTGWRGCHKCRLDTGGRKIPSAFHAVAAVAVGGQRASWISWVKLQDPWAHLFMLQCRRWEMRCVTDACSSCTVKS